MRTKGGHLVASAVEAALERSGRTGEWLAERSGIGHIALTSRLQGDEDFTMIDLANIASALGIPVASLTPSRPPGGL